MSYPSLRQDLQDWRTVCKVKPKKYQVSIAPGNDIDDSAFQDEEHTQFHLSVDDVNMTPESLCDSSGQFVECDIAEIEQDPTTNQEEEPLDVDLVLSGDEENDDIDYYSDSDEGN
ncbi:unnamed protein product [Amaranthus hypochondriacus]